jgi:hypothetical protein
MSADEIRLRIERASPAVRPGPGTCGLAFSKSAAELRPGLLEERGGAGARGIICHKATPKSGVGSSGGGLDACPSSCRRCYSRVLLPLEERW